MSDYNHWFKDSGSPQENEEVLDKFIEPNAPWVSIDPGQVTGVAIYVNPKNEISDRWHPNA